MQTRLFACLAGGLIGVVLASPAAREFALTPTFGVIVCSSVGLAIGYMVSLLFDVFAGTGAGQINSDE